MSKRRPTAYDRDQHELICELLGASSDPKYQGSTVYEAVVNILDNLKIESKLVDEAKRKEEELLADIYESLTERREVRLPVFQDGNCYPPSSKAPAKEDVIDEITRLMVDIHRSNTSLDEARSLLKNKDQELLETQRELADLKAGLGDLMTHGLAGVLARGSNPTISLTSTGCEATSFPY